MAIYYVNLSASGTSHAGTIGDPWSFADWQSNATSMENSTLYMRGSYNYTGGPPLNWFGASNGHSYLPWDAKAYGPWRLYSTTANLNISNSNLTISGGVLKSGESSPSLLGNLNSCYFYYPSGTLDLSSAPSKGCTFVANAASYGGQTFYDCAFVLSTLGHGGNTYNNCVFSLDPGGSNTYNNCQISWSNPTMPDWDAEQSELASSVVYSGVATPPQPGNSPYTNYDTGFWGLARTGIGAAYFGIVPIPHRSASSGSPDGNVGMPPKDNGSPGGSKTRDAKFGYGHSRGRAGRNEVLDVISGDSKFGSSAGNPHDNSAGNNPVERVIQRVVNDNVPLIPKWFANRRS